MRIDIDASSLEGKWTGVGRYTASLLQNWACLFPQNKYYLYFRHSLPADSFLSQECFHLTLVRCSAPLNKLPLWQNFFLARRLKTSPAQIFFSPSYLLPLGLKKKQAVQVFDISYIAHPEEYPWGERWYYRLMTARTLSKANIVLTGSHFSRKEILSYFTLPPEKVKVVYPGVEDKFQPQKDKEALERALNKYGIKGNYLLYLGLIAHRRNIPALLRGFKDFLGKTGEDYLLVLVGQNRSHPHFEVSQLAISLGLEGRAIHTEYVAEEDLPALYSGASLFIYPSSYEGFGLPVLEAMSCGVPVITSNRASLPEVTGDAAYLLEDPSSDQEIRLALEKVLSNPSLRAQMAARGQEQAKKFSWERCARETLEILLSSC